METYLEIKVPINYDDPWLEELRRHFEDIPVRWQEGFYHITMAFVNAAPRGVNIRPILVRHFANAKAPVLTLDRLGVFSTGSGMHIIHLSASQVPEDFLSLTESIRADMKAAGCLIQSDFMLHVTLGRGKSPDVELSSIKKLLDSVSPPSFTLTLTDVDYRVFRGRTLFEKKLN